ncbi:PREDICTED: uncharacterized protein LOC104811516 [Tarenaya hassleriana]|uniref:uncharacterized protein LOC104811516 n=1 Tax=Tarenaya hassleriana TaxID=28532 RepID=UPI00053C4883|nr:PREDICTED: uncharacterized protein LOC104811516 [Tarenaya hassleriana]XP_010536532.1 PREDICTED: uncharacterized protein LOC104811516 [Tarenaya hassleriana]
MSDHTVVQSVKNEKIADDEKRVSHSDEHGLFPKKRQKRIHHSSCELPSFQDMNWYIFREDLEEAEKYVKRVKDSWPVTGCSILLDSWVDANGRDLVAFIADCPEGSVYLKSYDVSSIKDDIDALVLMIDEIVAKVGGTHNVVQVISCSESGWVGELGKWFQENQQEIFWSVSVSRCFELMLDKIGALDFVIDTLQKFKNISEFIHSDPSVLKFFGDHSHAKELTVLLKNKSATPYLILEKVLTARNALTSMFTSSEWKNMVWASTGEGIRAASLVVDDASFWNNAETVISRVQCLLSMLYSWSLTLTIQKVDLSHWLKPKR